MSVHIQCPNINCRVTLSYGEQECPICETPLSMDEESIIRDTEHYSEKSYNRWQEQLKKVKSIDKDAQ